MYKDDSVIIADKYEVVGALGEGGTGLVYDAIRISDKMPVALKVIHESLAGDAQIRGRFAREAAVLRRLEGEHICPILDFGEVPREDAPSLLYIALPKIVGHSLADLLLVKGKLEVDRALDILLEVLDGLRSAHSQGVIHRDLKPANVLLEHDKKVIVADFGMSKIITGGGVGTTNLTTHNMVFGTPEYMSPEQARGDELDGRCDVYAAGVILYEMLTGAPPFTGESALSILTAHLTADIEPPSKRAPDRVTPALEAVTLGALARDRDRRYASASAFSDAVKHARRAPTDVVSVSAFAATMPASQTPVDANAETMVSVTPSPSVPSRKPSALPSVPARSAPDPEGPTRGWVAVWVAVALASIAAGVYLALR